MSKIMNVEREKIASQDLESGEPGLSEFRSLLEKLISHRPQIKHIGKRNEKGDISFAVTMADLGITPTIYKEHRKVLFSIFFANIMGELIVRENIDKFSEILTHMAPEEYLE